MPIYEYTCASCRKPFEKLVRSANEADGVPCPACGSKRTERALSVFAVSSVEGGAKGGPLPTGGPGCGRCGGPGPCAMG